MTKVLFLDDMPVRRDVMLTKFPDLDYARTSWDAIRFLQVSYHDLDNKYDLVCLDYDLDLVTSGDTGDNVVGWLVDGGFAPECSGTTFIVHSTNLLRGPQMVDMLRTHGFKAHYVPFSYMMGGPFNR